MIHLSYWFCVSGEPWYNYWPQPPNLIISLSQLPLISTGSLLYSVKAKTFTKVSRIPTPFTQTSWPLTTPVSHLLTNSSPHQPHPSLRLLHSLSPLLQWSFPKCPHGQRLHLLPVLPQPSPSSSGLLNRAVKISIPRPPTYTLGATYSSLSSEATALVIF